MTKLEAISNVNQSHSSIFTKEDVLNILEQIEIKQGITQAEIDDMRVRMINQIHDLDTDNVVDFDSAEFEIQYDNKISISDISVCFDPIEEIIENELQKLLTEEEGS